MKRLKLTSSQKFFFCKKFLNRKILSYDASDNDKMSKG